MANIKDSFKKEYNPDNTYYKVLDKAEKKRYYPGYLKPVLIACCVVLVAFIGFNSIALHQGISNVNAARSSDTYFMSSDFTTEDAAYNLSVSSNSDTAYNDSSIDLSDSKIIYTTSINIESKDIDSSISLLKDKINQYSGYIINSYVYTYGDNNEYTSCDYTVKIPVDKYQDFINEGNSLGNVNSISENSSDITSDYIDAQARLTALQSEYDTVSALLEKAESLEDTITIHDRLSSLQSDIESYQGQLNYYDSVTEYATVTVSISSVENYTTNKTWLDNLKETFINSFNNFVNVLTNILNFIIYLIPFVLIILVITLVVIVIRKRKNARK